jgi:P27 family predicted phage terminase small subunit
MAKKIVSTDPKPPKHLSVTTRRWFARIASEYELGDHQVYLLTLAAEAWDACQAARAAIAKHGQVYTDRFSAPRTRPEVAIQRDSRAGFISAVRALGLDIQPPTDDE